MLCSCGQWEALLNVRCVLSVWTLSVPVLGIELGVLFPLGVPGAELGPAPMTAARLGLAATVLASVPGMDE